MVAVLDLKMWLPYLIPMSHRSSRVLERLTGTAVKICVLISREITDGCQTHPAFSNCIFSRLCRACGHSFHA